MGSTRLKVASRRRSPERERLREAIGRHKSAARALADLEAAQRGIADRIDAAQDAVAKASAKLEAAKTEAARLAAVGEAPPSMRAARAAAEDARDALDALLRGQEDLRSRLPAAAREVESARRALDDRVADVLRSEVNVKKLLAEAEAAQADLVAARVTLRRLVHVGAIGEADLAAAKRFMFDASLPAAFGQVEYANYDLHPANGPLEEALEALRASADAPLEF